MASSFERNPNAIESGIRSWAAKLAIKKAPLGAKRAAIRLKSAQRMFQECEQGNRSEGRIGGVGQQAEKCARRRARQRPAGGIIDLDVPTRQFARDASGQSTIGCDERDGLSPFF